MKMPKISTILNYFISLRIRQAILREKSIQATTTIHLGKQRKFHIGKRRRRRNASLINLGIGTGLLIIVHQPQTRDG